MVPEPVVSEAAFVSEVMRGLATLWIHGGPAEEEDLSVPLGLSAWIVRAGIGLPDACDALLDLRSALLEVSGLDRRTEPVPLAFGDPRLALRTVGGYLFGLVGRAAAHSGMHPVALAEAALECMPARRVAS